MRHFFTFLLLAFTLFNSVFASEIQGLITDKKTGETLVGCTVYIKELGTGTCSGLDGSFHLKNIPKGNYTIQCSYISYQSVVKTIQISGDEVFKIDFKLLLEDTNIDEVMITAHQNKTTDISARYTEKNSSQVMNVVSAKTIELSPDLTVANVIQRVSGITLERSSTGDGQYALLRGMDKRFNYTLVNGIKIPSPDNKNRFVPLDIFPSELLDRLEVSKSLTADMEGDGIGGAINMMMKDAPDQRLITLNLATGYNSLFFDNDFQSFDESAINKKSPNEIYGLNYPAKLKDFTTKNMHVNIGKASPSLNGGITFGDRYFNNKLGIILAGSYMDYARGNSGDLYETEKDADGNQVISDRFYSNKQSRMGLHAKLDMQVSPNHKLMLYNAYMDFRNAQIRDARSSSSRETRIRWNRQQIMNSTLKGFHHFYNSKWNLDWTVSYGDALNETPDNILVNELITNEKTSVQMDGGATRRWEHNSDEDLAGYLNLAYKLNLSSESTLTLSTGGMYRDKIRDSYFNEYTFNPYDESKPSDTQSEAIRGVDYNNFDEISFKLKSSGNLSDPLNYGATEKISAGFLMGKLSLTRLQLIAGVRAEHTNQGYTLDFPTNSGNDEGYQDYTDILPSLSLKYQLQSNTNLRLTYSKAINRPSFFEIVPYSIINEDYKERGNPDLNHTKADNIDFRYEYFPNNSEQFMVGVFYKKIQDPIEYGLTNYYKDTNFGQDTYYMPINFGDANNYGLEIDFIKYFSWLGIKANYTYTNSNITTTKLRKYTNTEEDATTNIVVEHVEQTRPLYGQAEHVANLSFLLKDLNNSWDGQLAFSYTGDRIEVVSRYYNQDIWQSGLIAMDASVEKHFKSGLVIYAKASNLLNSPKIRYIPKNEQNASYTGYDRYKGGLLDRKEYYGQNILIGVRIKF